MEFPMWFTEAAQKRFEIICVQSQQHRFIQVEHARLGEVLQSFVTGLNADLKDQFLEVEESWTRLETLEKEWIYMHGMWDGAQLLLSLLYPDIVNN